MYQTARRWMLVRSASLLRVPLIAVLAVVLAGAAAPGHAGTASTVVRATAVVGGISHTCALTRTGQVKCWGYNGHDELGIGDVDLPSSSTAVDVFGLSGATAISAGVRHSCALTPAGGVKCWGVNYGGALGDGTTERRGTPVDVIGLTSGVANVAAGYDASCALTGAGGVKCWGSNFAGQVGDGTTTDRPSPVDVERLTSGVSAIAGGGVQTCALLSAGGVRCWGGYVSSPVAVSGSGDVTAITAGGPVCGLTSAAGVKCWSDVYRSGPVDVPGLSSGVTAIASSTGHTCALMATGGVKCWGLNDHGQLGDGTKMDHLTPVDVSGLSSGVRAIGAAGFHTCAVTKYGGVKCWGDNGSGDLGDGTTHDRLTPTKVLGFGPTATIAIASRSVAVTRARVAAIKLRCGAQARCRGTLTLTASVNLGSPQVFSIQPGKTQVVKAKITVRGYELLVHAHRLSAHARVRYRQPLGGTTTATSPITLVAQRSLRR
jgi:alpha-tubulin suppressor-like RCC1 family protein